MTWLRRAGAVKSEWLSVRFAGNVSNRYPSCGHADFIGNESPV
jgi:hypothetical protein